MKVDTSCGSEGAAVGGPVPIKCLVLMPVGPRAKLENVKDSIEAFRFYMPDSDSVMVILDDTRSSLDLTQLVDDRIEIISTASLISDREARHSTKGLFFVKQWLCLKDVARRYQWECFLRLDDDALITGPMPHHDAVTFFEQHPGVGQLGAYHRRGDGTDKREAMAKKGALIRSELKPLKRLTKPAAFRRLSSLLRRARQHDYHLGDMITGGSFFLSARATDDILNQTADDVKAYGVSLLDDDLLYSIHVAAAGLKLADFSDLDQIMAINWRGLPLPLEEIVRRQKKIIHPVKEPDDATHEPKVRAFFRTQRAESTLA